MKVYLVGVGMGNADTLTIGAERAIRGSDLLIGARRLLEPFADLDCEKLELIRSGEIAEEIARRKPGQASVLLSGDVGFYSGATALYDKLGDCDLEVIPGISSLSYFCAKLHTPWQDAVLVSAHGREHNACGTIQSSAKTFCITGGATKAEDICRSLVERGLGGLRAAVGERLSYGDERIVRANVADLAQMSFADLSVLLVWNPRPVERKFGAPSISDSGFWRGSAPMTKEEVRALSIAKLRIAADHTVWDVGAGTGSVSVEAALAAPAGVVYAIEKKPDALKLVQRNADTYGACNIVAVEGLAPEALEALPAPDRVFVGGSSGNIAAIIDAAREKSPQVRVCASAVTLETLAELLAYARENGLVGADIVQVCVSRADQVGSYNLMRAENPVYLVTLDFGEVAS